MKVAYLVSLNIHGYDTPKYIFSTLCEAREYCRKMNLLVEDDGIDNSYIYYHYNTFPVDTSADECYERDKEKYRLAQEIK